MKNTIHLMLAMLMLLASCGTQKSVVKAPAISSPAAILIPQGWEVFDTTTKG